MLSHITRLLLGIQDVEVTGVSEDKSRIVIDCTLRHDRVCPHCGSSHAWVHDHREQVLRDAPMQSLSCTISLSFHLSIDYPQKSLPKIYM